MHQYNATPGNELNLRHLTVDEALFRLDRYLNDAFMAGLYQVRIVHGKGTGTLRQAVHRVLSRHSLVKSFRLGVYGEGEAGVTVVKLVRR
jgi:DNA mismatch repair protein MutS2